MMRHAVKKIMLFLILALIFNAFAGNRAYHEPGQPEKVILENGLLKISFVPELNGRICGFEYLPQKRAMIPPLRYRVEKVDLLPDQIFSSMEGFHCRVWGGNARIIDRFKIEKLCSSTAEGCFLTMTTPLTGGLELGMIQQMQLLPDSTVLTGVIRMTNHQKVSVSHSLWLSCVFTMSDRPWPVLVPARSRVLRIGKFGMTPVAEDGVFAELHEGNRNMYFAALRPWMAGKAPGKPGIAVLQTDDPESEKMILYTHKSENLHTMEIISSPVKLAAGKNCQRKFKLLYFPSLTSLRDVCGFYGIDVKENCLEIESAVPAAGSVWIINGQKHRIPPLKPGKLHRTAPVSFPGKPLKIEISGKVFILPPLR